MPAIGLLFRELNLLRKAHSIVHKGFPGLQGLEIQPFCASDRHDLVIGVVAFVPTFLDSSTIIGDLPSESVTTPSHVPI